MHNALIKINDDISFCHYSGLSPFRAIVLNVNSGYIELKVTKDLAVRSFNEGDPVILGINKKGEMLILGSIISKVKLKEDVIEIIIDKLELGYENRQVERFPVSMCADLRTKNEKRKQLASIKDISYYGILFFSKTEVEVGETLELDIYLDKSMLFLKVVVNRKIVKQHYIEYGVGIKYEDNNSLNFMKDYIKRLKTDQIEVFLKVRK